ncbi:MAG TPA: acyclic terpene utilization AtuA family protein [Candidatus Dormibacteraeota bacterium]
MDEIRFIAASGSLGSGVHEPSLREALTHRPHFIAADAGTTDAGPAALGSGVPAYSRVSVRSDLARVLAAGHAAGVPVIIGSAGTAGADAHVDWTLAILREVCAELRLPRTVGVLRCEQSPDYLAGLLAAGRIRPIEPAPAIDEATIRRSRVVGMMGVEPIQHALRAGVDVVLAGRSSDSALYAAIPIAEGFPEALAWMVGKIVECNTMACVTSGPGVLLATMRHDSALITPVGPGLRCTPQSVAAHTLYENADPYLFHESSGVLELQKAAYEAEGEVSVRISGPTFTRSDAYSVKLEGAELAGYSTVLIGGIRDPFILARLDDWLAGVLGHIRKSVKAVLGVGPDGYALAVHAYGRDAVMGAAEPERGAPPREVGIVFEVLAPDQHLATEIAKASRQPFLHFPVPGWSGAISTIAYLHNPPQLERGPVYRFNLHHVALPETELEMFRLEVLHVDGAVAVGSSVG